jgi:hypothetical protein
VPPSLRALSPPHILRDEQVAQRRNGRNGSNLASLRAPLESRSTSPPSSRRPRRCWARTVLGAADGVIEGLVAPVDEASHARARGRRDSGPLRACGFVMRRQISGAHSWRRAERPMTTHTGRDLSDARRDPKSAGEQCSFTRGTHGSFSPFLRVRCE